MSELANNPCLLSGRHILVTRPAEQAAPLCALIRAAGGVPIAFPTVAIQPIQPADSARALLGARWDLIVFVSRNAVIQALALLPERRLPDATRIAAVGAGTASALRAAGRAPDLIPDARFDSEGLLELPTLQQVAGQRILIVRGVGGRPLLGDMLTQRGAEVVYAEVYRRALPNVDAVPLIPDWRAAALLLTATSDEVLNNLYRLIPEAEHPWLRGRPLAVFSQRTAATAMELGFRTVAVAAESSDMALLDALCRLLLQRPHEPR